MMRNHERGDNVMKNALTDDETDGRSDFVACPGFAGNYVSLYVHVEVYCKLLTSKVKSKLLYQVDLFVIESVDFFKYRSQSAKLYFYTCSRSLYFYFFHFFSNVLLLSLL